MENQNLIKMANNIGAFFNSEPDKAQAVAGIEQHLKSFWEPRMRRQIIDYVQQDGTELMAIVAEAVRNLAAQRSL
ncbi:MAG: formate dehydrogenase [Gammaproteobacteria bacterium HGW-Gammaproteobacteria-3]|jgi:formate dehydrogenase subunit delta|nr:MAG: formate dehydrogenase [Gammaproteobacteria bacterium HGW-Gammaproteobacteria-3]